MSAEKRKSLLLSIVDYVKKANSEASLSDEEIKETMAYESDFWNFVAKKEDINFSRKSVTKKSPKEPTPSETIKNAEELWKCLDDPEHIDRDSFQKRK